jgi:hypothetical protein
MTWRGSTADGPIRENTMTKRKLTPEERFRLQVQVRKAQRLQAEAKVKQAEAEHRVRLAANAKYVCFFGADRTGDEYVSRWSGLPIWNRDRAVIHADRQCPAIKQMQARNVTEATPEDVANMSPCWHRRCRIARGELDEDGHPFEPLAEPQGNSVRTVSGGAFEMNRRRH